MLSRLRGSRVAWYLVVAAAGTLVGAGGLAVAASRGGGVIRACASKRTGALRVATICKKKQERAISWNVEGPQGPRGATGATGATGAAGTTGSPGAPGTPATKLFAVVTSDGTIDASSPGVQADHVSTGVTELNFGQDVSHCAALAGIGAVPVYSSPGTSTGRTPGYAAASTASAGKTRPGSGYPSGNTVTVETFDGTTHSLTDTSIHVAVFC